jgi:hypothetical protein
MNLEAKVKSLLVAIETSQDFDEIIAALKLSLEVGNCDLATKTMFRILAIHTSTPQEFSKFINAQDTD